MSGIRSLIIAVALAWAATSLAQPLTVGSLGTPTGNFGPGPVTVLDLSSVANRDGSLTSVAFSWSAAPCPAAVKIRIFRRIHVLFLYPVLQEPIAERGPFDVSHSTQTVALTPPVPVQAYDGIAISSLTSCGGPVTGQADPLGGSYAFAGDWTGQFISIGRPSYVRVLVQATDASMPLLDGRFLVTMTATDPRSGKTTTGRGVAQGVRYGYFSLPEFTGDSDFPEVIVKMVDATASPPPFGGSFWFFYSPLTDVQYTLTVTDNVSGRVRTYSNTLGGPGQLCGGADTNAFPP